MNYFYRLNYTAKILLIVFSVFLISGKAISNPDGKTGRTLKSSLNGCGSCHSTRDISVSVLINGPASVTTGSTNIFSVTINKAGRTGAGVDIAVRRGALGVITSSLHLQSSELTHNNNISMSGGQVTLQFSYIAPSLAGTDTIFVTGLATDSDGSESGDSWNWATSFRVDVNPPVKILRLTELIEGFFNSGTGLMVSDTVRVYLRNTSSPYTIIDSAAVLLNSFGKGNYNFSNASNAVPYYIVLKHRNSIETWSKLPYSFSSGAANNYDFTTAQIQAYGDNLKLVGGLWTLYTGDPNQDCVVDASDISALDNDAFNFVSGCVNTDLNGDGVVDASDISVAENNAFDFVSCFKPCP